jgi:hypothetical protein
MWGVHDGDLTGRSAKTDEAELEPETERVGKRRMARRFGRGFRGSSFWVHFLSWR